MIGKRSWYNQPRVRMRNHCYYTVVEHCNHIIKSKWNVQSEVLQLKAICSATRREAAGSLDILAASTANPLWISSSFSVAQLAGIGSGQKDIGSSVQISADEPFGFVVHPNIHSSCNKASSMTSCHLSGFEFGYREHLVHARCPYSLPFNFWPVSKIMQFGS